MTRTVTLGLFVLLWSVLPVPEVLANPTHLFKIASLAPEGSIWVDSFKDFAAEVTEKSGGEIGFRIYPGGVMGDDRTMYRKMRVGQLQGGGFTMTGISDIVPDFGVMGIPFLFHSYEEVDAVSAQLQPSFKKRFAEQGLHFVAMTEVGFIYTFSNKPRVTIEDLRQAKTWAPSEDPLTAAFLKSLGISPITLDIPDVLSSLQTGLIDTAFNSLYGSIVLQWYTKAPFVTDAPYGYAYGVFIISEKAMSKLSDEQKRLLDDIAEKYFSALILKTRQSNKDSRKVLADQGVTFVQTTPEVLKTLEGYRDKAVETAIGESFSEEIYLATQKALDTFRSK